MIVCQSLPCEKIQTYAIIQLKLGGKIKKNIKIDFLLCVLGNGRSILCSWSTSKKCMGVGTIFYTKQV